MTTLKATHITKFDATPPQTVNARLHGAVLKTCVDAFEIGDTSNGDVTIVFKLPVDAVVKSLRFGCDDLTSGTLEIGLYRKNADGTYTAVDDNCFASSVALGSGAVAVTDVTYEAAATNISKAISPLWTVAGLSARPAYGELYVALTHTVGTGANGTVYMDVTYTE